MTRGDFLKACGLVAVGTALMRPVRALARRAEREPATLPPDRLMFQRPFPCVRCLTEDGLSRDQIPPGHRQVCQAISA
jgi:hypothetical protein